MSVPRFIAAGRWLAVITISVVALAVACSQPATLPASEPTATSLNAEVQPTATSDVAPTKTLVSPTQIPSPTIAPTTNSGSVIPSPIPTATPAATPTPEPTPVPLVTLKIVDGSKARYLTKEQFASRNLPNDAVGETKDVSGTIVFDENGVVQPQESKLVVNLRTLSSDDEDRDDYLLGNSLESRSFPFAEFVIQETLGLPWPLPQVGEDGFSLKGDMTIHNTTHPLTWEVVAQFAPDQVTGIARTNFTFGTFQMVRPSKLFLLSVEDKIRLEIEFVLSVGEPDGGGN